jgi:drug/metabolite transporter (DMT)-like permease
MHSSTNSVLKPILLLGALTLFWGLNWPGMKIILSELTVWWFRGVCLIIGGCLLLTVSALSGNRWKLRRNEIRPVLFCGSFAVLGWMVCSAYGVSLMPAGRASIVAFTMPLWATIIAFFVLGEQITASKVTGLMLGLVGLGALIGPDLLILQRAPIGALFMLMAALSWAFGTILIKKTVWEITPLSNIAWQLLFSSVPVTLVAVITEPVPDVSNLSSTVIFALIYLLIFPMSFCQWAYFKTVTLLPASIAAIGTMMVPVVGVYSSYLVLGEPIEITDLIALASITSALVLVLLVPAWRKSRESDLNNTPP